MIARTLSRRITWLAWSRWLAFPGVPLLAWVLVRKTPLVIAAAIVGLVLLVALAAWQQALRRQFIRESSLPRHLVQTLRERFPALGQHGPELVLRGLRQMFLAQLRALPHRAACPSLLVSTAWGLFAGHSAAYERWCQTALGRTIKPAAAYALGDNAAHNDALRRTWYWACKEESIDPRVPGRLPLLFALDRKYAVTAGFAYLPRRSDTQGSDGGGGSGAEFYFGEDFGDVTDGAPGDGAHFGGSDGADGSGGDGGGDGGGGDGGGGGD